MSLRNRLAAIWLCCRPDDMDDDLYARRERLRRREAQHDLELRNLHLKRQGMAPVSRPPARRTQSDSVLSVRPTRVQALVAVHLPMRVLLPPPALARVRATEGVCPHHVPPPPPRPRASPRSPLANEVLEPSAEYGGYFGEQS